MPRPPRAASTSSAIPRTSSDCRPSTSPTARNRDFLGFRALVVAGRLLAVPERGLAGGRRFVVVATVATTVTVATGVAEELRASLVGRGCGCHHLAVSVASRE